MLNVSYRTEYAIRALVTLAEHWEKPPVGLSRIAVQKDVSFKYLEQLMMALRKAGLVKARRGRTGGYSLTRPPTAITLAEVLDVLEGPVQIRDCAPGDEACRFSKDCMVKYLWREMERSLVTILRSRTLADLVPGNGNKARAGVAKA